MKPIEISNDGGKKLNVLGIPMVIRLHGSETGGIVAVVDRTKHSRRPAPAAHTPTRGRNLSRPRRRIRMDRWRQKICRAERHNHFRSLATFLTPTAISARRRVASCASSPLRASNNSFEDIAAMPPDQQQNIPAVIEVRKQTPTRNTPTTSHISHSASTSPTYRLTPFPSVAPHRPTIQPSAANPPHLSSSCRLSPIPFVSIMHRCSTSN